MGERERAQSLSSNSIAQIHSFPGSPGAPAHTEAPAGLSPEMSWLLAKKPPTSKDFMLETAHSSVGVHGGQKHTKSAGK